jgi:ABC-2 type transport system permease protein
MFAAPLVATLFTYLGLGNHFDSIQRGVIDSRDIVYYFSIIGFFLFMNIQSLAGRKWE